jgi:outer membrane protein assembly factor BamB
VNSVRIVTAVILAVLLSGCETIGGWFEDDDYDPKAPVPLADINETVRLKKAWSYSVGDGQGTGFLSLRPVIAGDRLYAVSAEGELVALDIERGRREWDRELDIPISGGVGYHEGSLFLGGADGLVMRLNAEDGEVIWRTSVSGEVLSPPQGNGKVVVAQTYDGKVMAFDYATGELKWTYAIDVPVLTLRGTGTPIIDGSNVLASFSDGKVLALNINTGGVVWEARVAIPEGRSEIERIVDIDGTMTLQGTELFAASYQGRVVGIETRAGRKLWQRNVSAVAGVSVGFGNVYVADEDGTVSAFLRNGQGIRWQNIDLGYRGLSRPTPVSSYVAVADFEGYVHLLSQVDGQIVGRTRADSDGARADMLSKGNRLFVFGNSGSLIAYDIQAKD